LKYPKHLIIRNGGSICEFLLGTCEIVGYQNAHLTTLPCVY
jgi:hypothetical protein